MIEGKFLPFVQKALDWTSRRQQALASNIANLDTPGYQSRDVDFAQEVQAANAMARTSSSHISLASDTATRVYQVQSKVTKVNGNNVDLDRELTEVVKNGVQYLTLLQFVNSKLRTLRTGINEGGR